MYNIASGRRSLVAEATLLLRWRRFSLAILQREPRAPEKSLVSAALTSVLVICLAVDWVDIRAAGMRLFRSGAWNRLPGNWQAHILVTAVSWDHCRQT